MNKYIHSYMEINREFIIIKKVVTSGMICNITVSITLVMMGNGS